MTTASQASELKIKAIVLGTKKRIFRTNGHTFLLIRATSYFLISTFFAPAAAHPCKPKGPALLGKIYESLGTFSDQKVAATGQ
jgi:hypothetical protein